MTPDDHIADTLDHTRDAPADGADTPPTPAQSDEDREDSVPEVVACGAEPKAEAEPQDAAGDDASEEAAQEPAAEEEGEVDEEEPAAEEEGEQEPAEEADDEGEPESADEGEGDQEPAGEEGEGEGEQEPAGEGGEAQPATPPTATPGSKKQWYVVKVQSGREDTIKAAIERRVKIEGLEEYFGQIVIPVEYIPEIRKGKRVEKRHKLYPGYLMVEVEFNDRILYLFRETSGVGDFVGGSVNRPPPPMSEQEVQRMVLAHLEPDKVKRQVEPAKVKARFSVGDRLRILDGAFSGWEAEVVEILEERARVRLEVSILGRNVPVELEYYQVEPL